MDLPWGNDQPSGNRPLQVLTVCEGNICRSPLAEQLLRARFAEYGVEAVVSSAGLGALVGATMDNIPSEISRLNGGDPDGHRARQLRSAIANDADVILTMTKTQRDTVVQRHPRTMRSAFSLVEFARLLAVFGGSGLAAEENTNAARVRSLASNRAAVKLTPADDIIDPYRLEREIHESVGNLIAVRCAEIARNLST